MIITATNVNTGIINIIWGNVKKCLNFEMYNFASCHIGSSNKTCTRTCMNSLKELIGINTEDCIGKIYIMIYHKMNIYSTSTIFTEYLLHVSNILS